MTKSRSLSQQRREEIFRAAHKCFVSRGFHATSMTDIAREFGMSVGHVYNYFPSKQAIIEGLIEQGIEEFYVNSSELLSCSIEGNFEKARQAIKRSLSPNHDPNQIRLTLELLVEATHDPKLSKVIEEADTKVRTHLMEMHHITPNNQEEEARLEVMMAMFEGLGMRILRHPGVNMEEIYDEMARRLCKPRHVLERQLIEVTARNAALEEEVRKLKAQLQ